MQTLPDYDLDALFRSALATDAEALSLAAANESEMLERVRQVLTRRRSRRQLLTLLIAAALVTLTAGAIALAADRLRPPVTPEPQDVSPSPGPSQSAAPSASPIPVAGPGGVWIPIGTLGTPRTDHEAVRLLDGRVLVVGGSGDESDPSTAEVYDPVSGTWSATGNMLNPRAGFAPVVLLDGKVLAGDVVDGSNGNPDVYGSELYDPATGTWSATGTMIGDWGGPAVVLPDGNVLAHESLYDPAIGTWSATGQRNHQSTSDGAAILLSDGTVLVAGGYGDYDGVEDPSFAFTDAAEIYDPATASWTEIANMHEPNLAWMATLLPDGRALVVARYGSWEIYDPATGTWTALPRPSGFNVPRALLSDGTVLMTDPDETNPGPGPGQCTATALYDPRAESLITASSMLRCAEGSSFTPLLDGTVLVAGGRDCNGEGVCVSTSAAAVYVPAGVRVPPLPAFRSPLPPAFPDPTPVPTPLLPADGPVPPNARSWTVTVENQGSEPATLFVAGDELELVGSATPNVVPAGTTVQVTFLFPAIEDAWIYVNPRPGEGGALVNAQQIGIPGRIVITGEGDAGWLSP